MNRGRRGAVALALALVVFAVWPWLPGMENDVAVQAPAAQIPAPLPPIRMAELRAAYPETLARPLFRSTRRPVPATPEVAAAPPAPPQLVGYRLTGIVSAGARRMILLETPGGKSVRLMEGESVDGWKVETIAEEAVVLSRDGTRVDLLNREKQEATGKSGRNTRWLPAGGQKQ